LIQTLHSPLEGYIYNPNPKTSPNPKTNPNPKPNPNLKPNQITPFKRKKPPQGTTYPYTKLDPDTTESHKHACVSYLGILLNITSKGRLKITLYDKRDDFNFTGVNFPFLFSKIPYMYHFCLLVVRILPSSFGIQGHVLRMGTFEIKANY
jgi:hypothetical protein